MVSRLTAICFDTKKENITSSYKPFAICTLEKINFV